MALRTSKLRPCSTPELQLTTPSAIATPCLATSLPCRVSAAWVTSGSSSLTNLDITSRPLDAVPKPQRWPRSWEPTSTLTVTRRMQSRNYKNSEERGSSSRPHPAPKPCPRWLTVSDLTANWLWWVRHPNQLRSRRRSLFLAARRSRDGLRER